MITLNVNVIRREVKISLLTSLVKTNVVSMVTTIPILPWLQWKVVVVINQEKRKEEVIVVIHQVLMVVTTVVCQVLMIQTSPVWITYVVVKMEVIVYVVPMTG